MSGDKCAWPRPAGTGLGWTGRGAAHGARLTAVERVDKGFRARELDRDGSSKARRRLRRIKAGLGPIREEASFGIQVVKHPVNTGVLPQ